MTQSSSNDTIRARLLAIKGEIRAGRLRAAAAALDALTAVNPADVRIHLCAAALARAAAKPTMEIEALKRAASLAPGTQQVHLELAKALSRHARHRQAVIAVNRAIELAPENIPALAVAVAVAVAAGAPALALRPCERSGAAARRYVDSPLARAQLTRQAAMRGRPHLRAVLDEFPKTCRR
jgi:predicted Zn-dependent protease